MKSDKRIKVKRIVVRAKDEVFDLFTEYAKKHNTTKTKIIEEFLEDLLKDDLKKVREN